MTTDKPLWTQTDCDGVIASLDRITANGTARARIVQADIERLRADLDTCYGDEKPWKMALLKSCDAEMARLCDLPGVMHALYGDEVIP